MRCFKRALVLGKGALFLLIVSACATDNEFRPTGASRADGIVQLSYDYDLSDRPVLDWLSAQSVAERRCASWGYGGARKSGAGRQTCLTQDIFGRCKSFHVNVAYHCTDAGSYK